MVADNTGLTKFPFERLNVPESCSLQVNDNGKGTMLCSGVAQIVQGMGDMHAMKRIGQRGSKPLGDVGIALEQDYVGGLHELLGSRRVTTAAELRQVGAGEGFAALRRSGALLAVQKVGPELVLFFLEKSPPSFPLLQPPSAQNLKAPFLLSTKARFVSR